jgi:membrane associated rhomboid family serine protease
MHEQTPEPLPEYIPPSRRRPIAWVTWTIVVSTVAAFVLQLIALHLYGEDVIGDRLAFSPQAFAQHHYWTLVTYAWAHAVAMFGDSSLFWLHIVANMIPLVCIGPALEEILGHMRFLGLYLGGTLVAGLSWFYFHPHSPEGIIGASGAVYAVIAAIGVAVPRAAVTVYLFYVLPLRMRMGVLAIVIVGFEVVQILFHWMPEVAHSAHIGGAIFGALYLAVFRLTSRGRYLSD